MNRLGTLEDVENEYYFKEGEYQKVKKSITNSARLLKVCFSFFKKKKRYKKILIIFSI